NQGIARLFKKYANKIECVILNACYSKVLGEAINQHINHVIGTKGAIRNDAAIAFSKGFYESLADGESIASAMEDGRDRIQLDIVNSGYSKRKLIPVVSEIEEEWLPEEEILTLLTKQQLNEIYETVSENATSSHAQNSYQLAKAFDILLDLKEVPLIKAALIQSKIEFADISEQLEMLITYKDLHDLLHKLEFNCYKEISQEVRHFPEDCSSISMLESYGQNLQDIIDDVKGIIAQKNSASEGITWHQDLDQALTFLDDAIEKKDKNRLKKVIWFMNRIIASQPSKINTALVTTAKVLPLRTLVKIMSDIGKIIENQELEAEKRNQFQDGITFLTKLDNDLKILVKSHDNWQTIDFQLRRIETLTANTSDLFELEMAWPNLKVQVQEQYQHSQESWAISLTKESERLDKLIAAQNSSKIKQYFSKYHNLASRRFYKVDYELRKFCENLREIRKQLTYLLSKI
ncbi:MAG: hypothetical protein WBM86_27240, partial [Waterburya sp.]